MALPDEYPQGEHLWLLVQKTGENTEFVARQLAKLCDVNNCSVGFAGMKDRHAITQQWYSIQLPGKPDPDISSLPDNISIIDTRRCQKKIQRGFLTGNRFVIRLREVDGDMDLLQDHLQIIKQRGFPNYFGAQRFGRNNLEQVRQWFDGNKRVKKHEKSILLSAARGFLFNAVLSERVKQGDWLSLHQGEPAILDGSRGFFMVENADQEQSRVLSGDIHPSCPLWGAGSALAAHDYAEWESSVVKQSDALLAEGLERRALKPARRATRVIPRDMAYSIEADQMLLSFELPAGSYATMLLRELVADLQDGAG